MLCRPNCTLINQFCISKMDNKNRMNRWFRHDQKPFPFFIGACCCCWGFFSSSFFTGWFTSIHLPFFSGAGFVGGGGVNTAFLGSSFFSTGGGITIVAVYGFSYTFLDPIAHFPPAYCGFEGAWGGFSTYLGYYFFSTGGVTGVSIFLEPIAHFPPVSCFLSGLPSFSSLIPSNFSKTLLDLPIEIWGAGSESFLRTGADVVVVLVALPLNDHLPFLASSI